MMLAEAGREEQDGRAFSSPRTSGLRGKVGGSCPVPVFGSTSYLPVGTDYGM